MKQTSAVCSSIFRVVQQDSHTDERMIKRAWKREQSGRCRAAASELRIFLFDDERPHVVSGFLVVLGVGAVAVRELRGEGRTRTLVNTLEFRLAVFNPLTDPVLKQQLSDTHECVHDPIVNN